MLFVSDIVYEAAVPRKFSKQKGNAVFYFLFHLSS